jgi:hypothetical protein
MSAMIDALERMGHGTRGVTTAEIIDAIRKPADPALDWHPELKSAVEELCGKLDGRVLGYQFRKFQRRNFGGRMLDKAGEDRKHGNRWAVFPATDLKRCPPSPASPAGRTSPAGDAGDAGDVPAQPEITPPTAQPRRRRFRNDDQPH